LNVRGRVIPLVTAGVLACVFSAGAGAGTVFQFAPTNPKAGSKYIQVRTVPTPADYTGVHLPDSAKVMDLYLVRNADAPSVHSVGDPRLIPLGRFDPLHISIRYRLPPLREGTYAMAATCLNCRSHKLYVIGVGGPSMQGPEPLMLLHAPQTPLRIWPFAIVTLLAALLAMATWAIVTRQRARRRESLLRIVAAATRVSRYLPGNARVRSCADTRTQDLTQAFHDGDPELAAHVHAAVAKQTRRGWRL
jgi:hypothetical protein